ncbi:CHAT domain-containing protein [Paractinoplanes atraurantiacus]|uniref:CHAT domain-containing protein n=1 Tax=Paractinoplanes atraurantiacus TaxID=1036182 RepID=A0A285IYQ2_9ACTN|nr:CHAT domain-containing protein [Actinoplanes atraurantiacus]SNY53179.1 CHAT domain-containing protein [Actinoplanes atraurantiacus]
MTRARGFSDEPPEPESFWSGVAEHVARVWDRLPGAVGPDWPVVREELIGLLGEMARTGDSVSRDELALRIADLIGPYTEAMYTRYNSPSVRGIPHGDEGIWEDETGPARRYVNTRLCRHGTETDIARDAALLPATGYDVLVNIGRRDDRSLLPADEAGFPRDRLPPGGLWLMLVVHTPAGFEQRWLYLPEDGDSYVCPCSPRTASHVCTAEQRRPFAVVTVTTPAEPARLTVRLAVYHGAAVVHVHEVGLPMTSPARLSATVVYSLTRSFTDLGPFRDRKLSVFTSPSAAGTDGRVYVNGVSAEPMAFSYSDQQAENACKTARTQLFQTHLVKVADRWTSTYDDQQAKKQAEFEADLLALARVGRALHASVFGRGDGPQIRQMLLHEAGAGPAVVQCGRLANEKLTIPWQIVYDLPMQSADETPYVCPSVRELGGPKPGVCPYEDDHKPVGRSVLCPYGFWGLAHILEVPPNLGEERALRHVVSEQANLPVATVLGWNPQPSPAEERSKVEALRHVQVLREGALGVVSPVIDKRRTFGERLAFADMDVVYVYAHCERQRDEGATASTAKIVFGTGETFTAVDVRGWNEYYDWPARHWEDREPLVVLNACHTGEILAATLTGFVDAFAQTAGAAGVVATEVTLEQCLAGLAMELFLAELARNVPVGEAMRRMRWSLLARGNVMGLAYTPYCAADLTLRLGGTNGN